MSYASHKHHVKHHRVSWGDTSYDCQACATTMEPMPYQSYRTWERPQADFTFNMKKFEEQRILDSPRAVKTTEIKQVNEDVNGEAEDFINLKHKKFARLSASMTMKKSD